MSLSVAVIALQAFGQGLSLCYRVGKTDHHLSDTHCLEVARVRMRPSDATSSGAGKRARVSEKPVTAYFVGKQSAEQETQGKEVEDAGTTSQAMSFMSPMQRYLGLCVRSAS